MPDQPTTQPQQTPTVIQQNNPPSIDGWMGLTGWIKSLAQLTTMLVCVGGCIWAVRLLVEQGRADRLEDRQMFRDSVKLIQDEDNRRTGEVKGAMDINTAVMRDLVAEIRAARHAGVIRSSSEPKSIPPTQDKDR